MVSLRDTFVPIIRNFSFKHLKLLFPLLGNFGFTPLELQFHTIETTVS